MIIAFLIKCTNLLPSLVLISLTQLTNCRQKEFDQFLSNDESLYKLFLILCKSCIFKPIIWHLPLLKCKIRHDISRIIKFHSFKRLSSQKLNISYKNYRMARCFACVSTFLPLYYLQWLLKTKLDMLSTLKAL